MMFIRKAIDCSQEGSESRIYARTIIFIHKFTARRCIKNSILLSIIAELRRSITRKRKALLNMKSESTKLYPVLCLLILYFVLTRDEMTGWIVPLISALIALGLIGYFTTRRIPPEILSEYKSNAGVMNIFLFFLSLSAIVHYRNVILYGWNRWLNDASDGPAFSWGVSIMIVLAAAFLFKRKVNKSL